MSNQETASRLRAQIDDLSTRLLMGDLGGGTSSAGGKPFQAVFEEIGRQARDAGYHQAASAAEEILANLDEAANPEAVEHHLRQGLVRLQQAIEDSASAPVVEGAAAERRPAINSLAQDPELVADFVVESREHLTSVEQRLFF